MEGYNFELQFGFTYGLLYAAVEILFSNAIKIAANFRYLLWSSVMIEALISVLGISR